MTLAEEIIEKTCKAFNTTTRCLDINNRKEHMVLLRTAIVHLLHVEGGYTMPEIAKITKWKRVTCLFRERKHHEYMKYLPKYRNYIAQYNKKTDGIKVVKKLSVKFKDIPPYHTTKKETWVLEKFIEELLQEKLIIVDGEIDDRGNYTHNVKLVSYESEK